MRNDHDVCGPRTGNKWKEDQNPTIDNGTGKGADYPWIPLAQPTKPDINWKMGEIARCKDEERRFFFNDKNLSPQELRRHLEKKTIIEGNPTEPLQNKDELPALIASITREPEELWINAKATTATQLQAEATAKKKILPLEEQIPEEFHKKKPLDSPNHDLGITKLS